MNSKYRSLGRGILLVGLVSLFGVNARAWIFQEVPDKAVEVHYKLAVAAAVTTNTVIVDLSDTVNFPHKETGELNIDSLRIDVDKAALSSGTVKVGIVNYVDSSTGSVTWIWSREFAKNVSNTDVSYYSNFLPAFLKCRVNTAGYGVDGNTPYILSSDKTSGATTFQTDVNLPNTAGTSVGAGTGDLILQVVNLDPAVAITVTADLIYHSNQR